MKRAVAAVLLATLVSSASAQSLQVTPTFNSGAMLICGDTKVFLDTVFRHHPRYQSPDAAAIRAMEKGAAPYDGPLLILASHNHADHFDEKLVAAVLAANPRAQLAGTSQIAGRLKDRFPGQVKVMGGGATWTQTGIEVRFLVIPHGGERWAAWSTAAVRTASRTRREFAEYRPLDPDVRPNRVSPW